MDVTADGVVDPGSVGIALDGAALCSIMWVNNETGVIQPIEQIGAMARERGVVMHTDAVQAFGKVPLDMSALPVDLLTISGHKICAPKGIGAIAIRRGTAVEPLLYGGSQDRGRRPGTENVAGAVALARAAELVVAERESECARLRSLRDELECAILDQVPDAVIHGRGAPRAPHILNVSVPGVESESMLMALDLMGIACSGGSACQSGAVSASYVLTAMGVSDELAGAALRLSLGCLSTQDCVRRVSETFPKLVQKARRVAAAS